MSGPLEGVRVIDFTVMIAGPMATQILGEQGADVVKVEPPGGGDRARRAGFTQAGMSAIFASANLGKRSIALDVTKPAGKAAFQRLVASADVFVQNYRPGVMERMGIDEPSLRRLNPDLIYVSLSGFGESGPYAQRRAIDSVIQAISGTTASQADEHGKPRLIQTAVCDKATAWTAAQAITAALFARDRGRGGQHIRISMLAASIAFLWPDGGQRQTYLREPGEPEPVRAGYLDVLPTADGWVVVSGVDQPEFEAVCRACEREDLLRDTRLADPASRFRNLGYLSERLGELVRAHSNESLARRFDAEDVCYGFVNPLAELHEDPQVVQNRCLVEIDHPTGRARHTRAAARFERTPTEVPGAAPLLGEHGESVLAELGMATEEVDALKRDGVLA